MWEFSDDHNVFTGSKIAQYHCYFYSQRSLSQLEKSLSVCSLSRIKVGNNGLLFVQMAIKNDTHNINKGYIHNLSIEDCGPESEEENNQQFFNTEFVIFPINYVRDK